jgi:hypothetical protein
MIPANMENELCFSSWRRKLFNHFRATKKDETEVNIPGIDE